MRGYCSMGRPQIATPPSSIVTSAITLAKTGWSMKNREIMGAPSRVKEIVHGPCSALRQVPKFKNETKEKPWPRYFCFAWFEFVSDFGLRFSDFEVESVLIGSTLAPGRARCKPS